MKKKFVGAIKNGYFMSLVVITLTTLIFYPGRLYFAKGQWSLLYLLLIVFIAGVAGVWPAVLASFLSFFAWNYFFLPPYHTFLIDDPKDLISLFTFLVVGIVIGLQTAGLKKREHTLAQADALREADRLKTIFVSSISHELKTPLASIMATITNLLEKDVKWEGAVARVELEAIKRDLDRLNISIGSLVDFSRLEADVWQPKKEWYELGEIVGATLQGLPDKAKARIKTELPEDLPLIKVDFTQISRALGNIIENALVYSAENSPVEIMAEKRADEIRLRVEDEGPGIPEAEREKVFKKFFRGRAGPRNPLGTGLGLAIAAEIIKAHHGKILVEDARPKGARLTLALPLEETNERAGKD